MATLYEVHGNSKPLSLRLFSERYGSRLPQVISASESLYGTCEDLFQHQQEFEVYFKKETPVVSMKMAGRQYSVPLNSAFKFSVLYNPNNDDLSAARRGYVYETVADLIKADPIPSVVYVGKECTTSRKKIGSEIIKKGQILLIQELKLKRKEIILVCLELDNIEDPKEVCLTGSCEGHFSTKESLLLFYLKDIIKHIKMPFNTSVFDAEGEMLHPNFYQSCATIVDGPSTLHSLIASSSSTSYDLLELCTTMSLEFLVIEKSGKDFAVLKEQSSIMSLMLSPKLITNVIYDDTSPTENTLQKDLLLPRNNSQWLQELVSFTNNNKMQSLPAISVTLLNDSIPSVPPPLPPRRNTYSAPSSPRGSILIPKQLQQSSENIQAPPSPLPPQSHLPADEPSPYILPLPTKSNTLQQLQVPFYDEANLTLADDAAYGHIMSTVAVDLSTMSVNDDEYCIPRFEEKEKDFASMLHHTADFEIIITF